MKMSTRVDVEKVKNKLADLGLICLSEIKKITDRYELIDNDGYKYYNVLDNIMHLNNCKPLKFSKHNPHTIENIHHYIEINNINAKLISSEYINNRTLMEWKCACGNKFLKCWSDFQRGGRRCLLCADKAVQDAKYIPKETIKTKLEQMGLFMIESTFTCLSDGFYAFTKEGYIVRINKLTIYNNSRPEIFHPLNLYTIYNINRYFDLNRNGEYKCVSKNYINNSTHLDFIHIPCGNQFKATWNDMMIHNSSEYHTIKCQYCYKGKSESFHASVLKQIFKHEYPKTVLEDRSCINPLTNASLPTDIVNHQLNIAIEIQSQFHDQPYQKIKDNIKKKYWINRGYRFYALDIRDYNVIDMIKIFFPTIIELPNYIKTNFEDQAKYDYVQKLIDSRKYKRIDIIKMANISIATLYYWSKQSKIKLL